MRVAVAAFAASLDKEDNLARLSALVERAGEQDADLVIAPEASMHDFGTPDLALAPVAEQLDGPFVTGLAEAAKRGGIAVIAGMFEAVPGETHVYNAVVAIGPDGALIGRYRKQHLFDALGWKESDRLLPGDPNDRLVFSAGDIAVGVMTCYDVRFPELARALADDGADLIAIPSAWVAGENKLEQWQALTTARAIENVCYVAGAVQLPPTYTGGSRVVDPWGRVIAEAAPDEEGLVVAELSADEVKRSRDRMPSLANRRWTVEPR